MLARIEFGALYARRGFRGTTAYDFCFLQKKQGAAGITTAAPYVAG
jgi:hypothetical protein